jgi:hypothetical protein
MLADDRRSLLLMMSGGGSGVGQEWKAEPVTLAASECRREELLSLCKGIEARLECKLVLSQCGGLTDLTPAEVLGGRNGASGAEVGGNGDRCEKGGTVDREGDRCEKGGDDDADNKDGDEIVEALEDGDEIAEALDISLVPEEDGCGGGEGGDAGMHVFTIALLSPPSPRLLCSMLTSEVISLKSHSRALRVEIRGYERSVLPDTGGNGSGDDSGDGDSGNIGDGNGRGAAGARGKDGSRRQRTTSHPPQRQAHWKAHAGCLEDDEDLTVRLPSTPEIALEAAFQLESTRWFKSARQSQLILTLICLTLFVQLVEDVYPG